MRGLSQRLSEIREYLEHVVNGRLPVNHDIMYMLQARPNSIDHSFVAFLLQLERREIFFRSPAHIKTIGS